MDPQNVPSTSTPVAATPAPQVSSGRNMFGMSSYYLPAVIAAVVALALGHYLLNNTDLVPGDVTANLGGFLFLGTIVVLLIQALMVAIVARLAKVENRSFDKALFTATGGTLIKNIIGVITLLIVESYTGIALVLSLAGVVVGWFFMKRVYETSNRKVLYMVLWTILITIIVGIVFAVLGMSLFTALTKGGM